MINKLIRVAALTLLLPTAVQSNDYEVDINTTSLNHAWRGPNNISNFDATLYGLGVTAWKDNIGFRLGYVREKT